MFDLSLAEMMVIGLAAVLAIGPKDLPVVLRTLGRWWGQIRALGNEFKRQFEMTALADEVRAAKKEMDHHASMIRGDTGDWYETYEIEPPSISRVNAPTDQAAVPSALTPEPNGEPNVPR